MEAGRLTERLVIEKLNESDDVDGEGEINWTYVGRVWASVMPLRGVELLQAQQATNRVNYRVTIHYQSGIRPGHNRFRRVKDDTILTIESALELKSAQRWLECGCREEP